MPTETFEFQVEARQLLQMMIHSIYSNKDVFLRELISNASDALDKLRIEALRDDSLAADVSDLHIAIEADREARTLTIRDNGIGMSHDDVVRLIGTIAKSGTGEFLQQLKEAKNEAAAEGLIGQFGVGFYSSFMVADEVTLLTRRAGEDKGTLWTSSGQGSYTIATADEAPQGTAVTLRLKPEDAEDRMFDYTDPAKIREIVKRYSDFITWPIRLVGQAPGGAPEATADGAGEDGAEGEESAPRGAEEQPEPETLNSRKALWARPRNEVSDAEYHELYKHISHDWADPLEIIPMRAEGTFEYQALLFLPSRPQHDLFSQDSKRGVQLYVKRVLIMENCEALVPDYLRFVKGVVDAADLSLNVSREILQQDRQIQLMHRRLAKKVLSTVKEMKAKRPDNYAAFWRHFGAVVKEGLLSDFDNRDTILGVSSFATTNDAEQPTSLQEYIDRMKEGQQHIFYMTGESRNAVESSPHMEAFREKGYEVLILTDPVDEVWVGAVPEFQGKELRSIAKGEAGLDGGEEETEEAKAEREQQREDYAALLTWMGEQLSESVKEVRLSSRLTVSPACVVSDQNDVTPALQNLYRAMGQDVPAGKRILELNPGHPLVEGLRRAHTDRASDPGLPGTAEVIYGMALLAEGSQPDDPARFTKLLAERLERAL
ncbi:molecular chaperone HtpG [Streptomyces marincola]|uniref:molecular chaperone HtpG n=1 Tax=Streptomyces marincola TaxID=2878388 RepID=UPI001CF11714|nr:molecular chaperone HtpG [Streptomyces marincola]UCM91502.1 molecular chaperone HtpG [Streptomyces marincola]